MTETNLEFELASSSRSAKDAYVSAFGLHISNKDYEIFTPEAFSKGNKEEIVQTITETSANKVKSRLPRIVMSLIIPAAVIPAIAYTNSETLPIAKVLGIGLLVMFIAYFMQLFYIFFRTYCNNNANLFRIYSLNSIKPDWAPMAISYRAIVLRACPIESISEFSAIQGGIAGVMLSTLSTNAWAIVVTAIAFEYRTAEFELGFGDVCELIGCFGLVLIGTYELDPFNKMMEYIHYGGAGLGLFTLIGYFHQQYRVGNYYNNIIGYIWFPILVNIIAIISFICWIYFGKKAKDYTIGLGDDDEDGSYKYDSKIVTKISLQNVFSEAIFLFCGAFSMCLWLIQYAECYKISINGC